MDYPLLLTILLFLVVLGPGYAWGLIKFFRHNFQWHLASMVGISATVSITAILVWNVRGISSWEAAVIDLAIVFTAASPWMALVGWILDRDRKSLYRQLNITRKTRDIYKEHLQECNTRLMAQEHERQIMVVEIKRLIEQNQKSDYELFIEALKLIGLRQEAERMLENRRN
jgi:hypothetical protein